MSAPVELSAEELSAIRAWVANVAGHGGSLTSADWLTIGRLGGHKAQFLPEVLMEHIGAREAAHAAEVERLYRLLHDLTPGGSEFAGNPERCVQWVRDRLRFAHDIVVKLVIESRDLKAERDGREEWE